VDHGANLFLKYTKIHFAAGLHPVPLGELAQTPSRNQGGPTSKGRDISIDWPQNGTASLKCKAQR